MYPTNLLPLFEILVRQLTLLEYPLHQDNFSPNSFAKPFATVVLPTAGGPEMIIDFFN